MMKRDEDEHQIDTVPPPPGEEDAYSAETRIGKIPTDLLQQMKRAHAGEAALSRLPPEIPGSSPASRLASTAPSAPPKIGATIPPPPITVPRNVSEFPIEFTDLDDDDDDDEEERLGMMIAPRGTPLALPETGAAPSSPPTVDISELDVNHDGTDDAEEQPNLEHRVPSPEVLRMVEEGRIGQGRMSFDSLVDYESRRLNVLLIVGAAFLLTLVIVVWIASK